MPGERGQRRSAAERAGGKAESAPQHRAQRSAAAGSILHVQGEGFPPRMMGSLPEPSSGCWTACRISYQNQAVARAREQQRGGGGCHLGQQKPFAAISCVSEQPSGDLSPLAAPQGWVRRRSALQLSARALLRGREITRRPLLSTVFYNTPLSSKTFPSSSSSR